MTDISSLAGKIAESNGLELVDVELFRAGRRRILRVYIGKVGAGITVDDCAKLSRDLSARMDAENMMGEEPYHLEVSSPGLDRPFKTIKDYRRNVGRLVRVSCREPVEGKRLLIGKLEDVGEATITLDEDGKTRSIPLDQIVQAKVEIRLS
jgi:ribosome maturation factor RimP